MWLKIIVEILISFHVAISFILMIIFVGALEGMLLMNLINIIYFLRVLSDFENPGQAIRDLLPWKKKEKSR